MCPVLVNKESGLAEELPQQVADSSLQTGTHEIPLNDPEGNPVTAPVEQARELIQKGYSQPSSEQFKSLLDQTKNESLSEQAKGALEGAASTLSFGVSPAIERAMGVQPEDIQRRAETTGHTIGTVAPLLIPGVGEIGGAGLIGKAGKLGEAAAGLVGDSKILNAALRGGAETAILQAQDETSKYFAGDPNSFETAMGNVGMSGLLGGAFSAPFGAVAGAASKLSESRLGQEIENFKNRIKFGVDNPNPAAEMTNEVTARYNQMKENSLEAKGLNRQEIQNLTKDVTPEAASKHVEDISQALEKTPKALQADPQFQDAFAEWKSKVTPEVDPITLQPTKVPSAGEVFEASDKLKRQLQEWGKYNKTFVPLSEVPFRNAAKSAGYELRTALEDSSIWGKAADRQKAVNEAIKDYIPALEDFEKKFTSPSENSQYGRVVDPATINTYWNQLGKPNAELKQEFLDSWMKHSEKFQKAIEDTHANLGLETPFEPISMNLSHASLDKITPGAKVADALIHKGVAQVAGKGLGGIAGGLLGSMIGHGELGALAGTHMLGPVFSSILPAIAKPVLENPANAAAFKNLLALGAATIKGETMLNKAAGAVFSREAIPAQASPKDLEKLRKQVDKYQADPSGLENVGGQTGHYMPNHAAAMGQTAARAITYLSALKPKTTALGPMDQNRKPSAVEEAAYSRALEIAEKPTMILKSVQQGTLTGHDLATLKAIYPALYSRMSQKLMAESIDHITNGKSIPYATKMAIAKFMGEPLDSSMTPQAIQMIQASMAQANTSSQSQTPQPSKSIKQNSMKGLSSAAQTPGQAREAQRITK